MIYMFEAVLSVQLGNFSCAWNLAILQVGPRSGMIMQQEQISSGAAQVSSGATQISSSTAQISSGAAGKVLEGVESKDFQFLDVSLLDV